MRQGRLMEGWGRVEYEWLVEPAVFQPGERASLAPSYYARA
jgi:hypothetical protein